MPLHETKKATLADWEARMSSPRASQSAKVAFLDSCNGIGVHLLFVFIRDIFHDVTGLAVESFTESIDSFSINPFIFIKLSGKDLI